MRLSYLKIFGSGLLIIIPGCAAYQIFSINHEAQKTLADTKSRLNEETRISFIKKNLVPHTSQNIEIRQNTETVRDFVKFGDSYYAATSGGLMKFSVEGKPLKHFTVLDGLPESDLTCLTVFEGKLLIGTKTKNLVTFDGEKFDSYTWTDRQAQAVTSFLEKDGNLLIGTRAGGLIEFDGKNFTELKAEKKSLKNIDCLYEDGADLLVGTFDNGLWIYQADVWKHFTVADNLPSNRIVGIAVKDKKIFVATDFGLAVLEGNSFRALAEIPSLASLSSFGNQLFLVKDNGQVYTFGTSVKEFATSAALQNARLAAADEKLWLLSNQGISEIKGAGMKPFSKTENNLPTDNFISAMAFDASANLWLGTFRRGIDVFSAEGRKLTHLETPNLREVNYLALDNERGISAATSEGLIKLSSNFSVSETDKNENLPSRSVTHFSGNFIATSKGLILRESNRLRLLSTVQGLPNNSIYATQQIGEKSYAGTLGGLAEIQNGRVTRTYKDSNSNLTTNWVTALCQAGDRLFIGTYGGGIFELTPAGEIRSLVPDAGKFTVNPNALFSDGAKLYAGTLEGVKILNLQTGEWSKFVRLLPAETVLSVNGDAENIYFGTTNGLARIEKSYFAGGEGE